MEQNKKMRNAAKYWDTGAKVCCGIFCAVAIVCFVFAVLLLIFGEKVYEVSTVSLDLDFIKFYLSEDCQTANQLMQLFYMVALLGIGGVLLIAVYGLRQLRDLLAPMKEGRPFEENAPRKLKSIAWAILAGGAVLQITAFVERMIMTKTYPMEEIFSSPLIEKIEYSYTVDFSFVFVACLMIFLSHIFSYGQKLQQESDETL